MEGLYTLDWQEYEYEENRVKLHNLRKEFKRKWVTDCKEHGHYVLCKLNKCESLGFPKRIKYENIDGTEVATKVRNILPVDIRRRIRDFYNQMYYFVPKQPARLLNQIIYKYTVDLSHFLVMNALDTPMFDALRGYCGSCGEPCVHASYFYWHFNRKPLRTNKRGLVIMRACQPCTQNGLSIDDFGRKVWLYDYVGTFRSFTTYPFALCN
jgi:hypothetical protein